MIAAWLMLQAAAATPSAAAPHAGSPQHFSILLPDCPTEANSVVVCANRGNGNRLPLPDERAPSGPAASNPRLDGVGAMAAEAPPCGASMQGCLVGFGPPIVPTLAKLVDVAKRATAKKPDKTGRVPIPLD